MSEGSAKSVDVPLPWITSRLFNRPLAITQSKLDTILMVLGPHMNVSVEGLHIDEQIAGDHSFDVVNGALAVIPVMGTLVHRTGGLDALSGLTSYSAIQSSFISAMEDFAIRHVMFDVDSNGGEVDGLFDFVDTIFGARGMKPMTAMVNESAFSAAYAIASAADEIVVTRTAGTGSIGVRAQLVDQTAFDEKVGLKFHTIVDGEFKADGDPHAPISKETLARVQEVVDSAGSLFRETVARNRGMTVEAVTAQKAGLFYGQDAVDAGLADRVAAVNETVGQLLVTQESSVMAEIDDAALTALQESNAAMKASNDDLLAKLNALEEEKRVEAEAKAAKLARKKEIEKLCQFAGTPQLAAELVESDLDLEACGVKILEAKAMNDEDTAIDSSFSSLSATDVTKGKGNPMLAEARRRREAAGLR